MQGEVYTRDFKKLKVERTSISKRIGEMIRDGFPINKEEVIFPKCYKSETRYFVKSKDKRVFRKMAENL